MHSMKKALFEALQAFGAHRKIDLVSCFAMVRSDSAAFLKEASRG